MAKPRIGGKWRLESGETGVVVSVALHSPKTYIGYLSMREWVSRFTHRKIKVAVERTDRIDIETIYLEA